MFCCYVCETGLPHVLKILKCTKFVSVALLSTISSKLSNSYRMGKSAI